MKKLVCNAIVLMAFFVIGNLQATAQESLAQFKDSNGLWGYINIKGDVVIPAQYSPSKAFSPDGYALVKEKKSKEYSYINVRGEKISLDRQPDKFGNFSEGMAMVRVDGQWGYVDTQGKLVIPARYSNATDFYQGKALAQDAGGKVLLIDKTGNETDLSALGITAFKEFREGMAPVQINDGNWGFLNTEGKLIIEATYFRVGYFSAGLAWVKPGNDQVGFIDKTNEMVIAPGYASVKEFDHVSGRARVKNAAGNWLYIDKQGKELTVDASRFGDFSEGLCSVDKSSDPGVYGFIDAEGNWVIEPKYEGTGDFHSGVCRVRMNKKWGLIDKEGNVLIEPKYDGLEDFVRFTGQ